MADLLADLLGDEDGNSKQASVFSEKTREEWERKKPMADIAKRLRARLGFVKLEALPVESIVEDYIDAADEIERLRHDVSRQMDIANEQLQEVEMLRAELKAAWDHEERDY